MVCEGFFSWDTQEAHLDHTQIVLVFLFLVGFFGGGGDCFHLLSWLLWRGGELFVFGQSCLPMDDHVGLIAICICCQDCGRLVYVGQDDWVHVNCALWSAEVYEEVDGTLQHVQTAIARGKQMVRQQLQLYFLW